jgi:hypothetical protein
MKKVLAAAILMSRYQRSFCGLSHLCPVWLRSRLSKWKDEMCGCGVR